MKKQSPRNVDELQTVDKDGVIAPSRIFNATSAWTIFKRCLDEDTNNAAVKRSKIQGLIDGNPPYSEKQLENMGQKWRSNVNFREAESIRDGNTASYFALLFDVPTFVSVKVRGKKDVEHEVTEDWGQAIAEEYTDLIMEWPDFLYHFTLHVKEMLTYGLGPVLWPDKFDWRFKAFQLSNFLIPPRTRSSIGYVRLFFMRDTMNPKDMLEIIENEKATEMGYNIAEMKRVLIERYSNGKYVDSDKYGKSAWESTQQRLKNNDGMIDNFDDVDDLKIVHGYVQEMKDGKISHFIIPETESTKEYMLMEEGVYDSMDQVFCPFLFDIGDGFMRSVRGIGQRLYAPCELSNRFINTTFDGAMLNSSMVVGSTGPKKDLRLLRIGPLTVLPEGVQPIQSSFTPNLSGIIAARGMLQGIIRNNHGQSSMPLEGGGGSSQPQRTTTEVMIAEQKDARLQNFQIIQYYQHLQRCHQEMIRRLVSEGYPKDHPGYEQRQDFIQRCLDRGVPRSVLTNFKNLKIRVMRAIGGGSEVVRESKLQRLLGASAMFDQRGKMNVLRDWTASLAGYDGAERYIPIRNRDQIMTNEHSMAEVENAILATGKPVVVGVDQVHMLHLSKHIPPIMQICQEVEATLKKGKQINPEPLMPYLQQGLQHWGGHMQLLAADPRHKADITQMGAAYKVATHTLKLLAGIQQKKQIAQMKQMQEHANTMQEAQQAIQSDELKAKLAKVQTDFQARMTDVQNKAKVREFTAQHNAKLKEIKLQTQLQMEQAEKGGMQ